MVTKEQAANLDRLRRQCWSKRERSRDALYRKILQFTQPEYIDWENMDGDGSVVNPHIYNSVPAECSETFAMGISGYACSAGIDWFKIEPEKKWSIVDDKSFQDAVRGMFQQRSAIMRDKLAAGNWYDTFESAMKLFGDISTVCVLQDWDDERGNVSYTLLHPRDFVLMQDRYGSIDTVIYRQRLNRSDIIGLFGKEKTPRSVLDNKEDFTKLYTIYRYIGTSERIELSVDGEYKWVSVYWFAGDGDTIVTDDDSCTLAEARIDGPAPFNVIRFKKSADGTNPYGVGSPGMKSVFDMAMLQTISRSVVDGTELVAHPVIKRSPGLPLVIKPRSIVDVPNGMDFAPVNMSGDLSVAFQEEQIIGQRIKEAYNVPYFLALMNSIEKTKTATEAQGLQNEQSAMLTSMFSRISEFLENALDYLYYQLEKHGMFAKTALYGLADKQGRTEVTHSISFISPMTTTQRRTHEWAPIQNMIATASEMASLLGDPTVLTDNIKVNEVLHKYAETNNVDVTVLYTADESSRIRKNREEIAAQQAAAEQARGDKEVAIKKQLADNAAPEAGSPNASAESSGNPFSAMRI